ncbi:MAG TPA: glutamine synthetase family protein [Afifellaceae bacterium]|nr:glutamine synthetase family protein [Afifellaceae bacterium]
MSKKRPQTTGNEGEAYLKAHPDLEAMEFLISDTNGVLRGKWSPAEALEKAFSTGINFPLSMFGLDVWGREVEETGLHIESGDADGFCMGVPGSIRPVPWASSRTAQCILTMNHEDGSPFFGDPRNALSRITDRLAANGLAACAAFELEFFLLDPESDTDDEGVIWPINVTDLGPDRQHMYALSELSELEGLFSDIREAAKAQAIPIDTMVSEAAPGQFEINLKHRDDILAAADDAVMLKRLVGETARQHGLRASFMAKPFNEWPGNGMHIHVSLVDGRGRNFFADRKAGETRRGQAIAGLLKTMREAAIFFVPTFNGFRRLQPGSYAPTRVAWGRNNRSVALRIPPSDAAASRIEHRIAGADANPYLVAAAVLAGMMEGLDDARDPPAAVDGNAYDRKRLKRLPDNMYDAIELFEESDFIARHFGERYRHLYAETKKAECETFLAEITALERETYL